MNSETQLKKLTLLQAIASCGLVGCAFTYTSVVVGIHRTRSYALFLHPANDKIFTIAAVGIFTISHSGTDRSIVETVNYHKKLR